MERRLHGRATRRERIVVMNEEHLNPGAMFELALEGLASGSMRCAEWIPPTVEEVQRQLPQCSITSLIGRGGMGAVYLGRQEQLDRPVAIKILPPGIDADDLAFAERFKQEARAMARFKHPGIVAVHDAGETPGGLLYFVMEFVEGTDVGELLARHGRFAPAEAIRIAGKVCEALAYAHDRGVVHRDIKPSNVMIESDGTVKVADFGLAKLTFQDSGFTRSDLAIGSADFAAPECAQPGIIPDARADLFSLGVMLYQMLTGTLPRGRFDPPSRIVEGLDPRLDAIIDKALRTDRDKRYPGALEMGEDLERLTSGRWPPATRLTAATRHRILIGGSVLLLLMAVVAIIRHRSEANPAKVRSTVEMPIERNARPQWQKIEFAALDPAAATTDQALRPMDGDRLHLWDWDRWLVPVRMGAPDKQRQRNVAIRATFRIQNDSRPKLCLRLQRPAESQYFLMVYSHSVCLGRQIKLDMPVLRLFALEPSQIPQEGAEATFQLACVGHRLYVWFNGSFLGHVDDDTFDQAGEFGIQAKDGRFKSLEYLLLDHLSEAEALKLIEIP